jgi:hypothetical protein
MGILTAEKLANTTIREIVLIFLDHHYFYIICAVEVRAMINE